MLGLLINIISWGQTADNHSPYNPSPIAIFSDNAPMTSKIIFQHFFRLASCHRIATTESLALSPPNINE